MKVRLHKHGTSTETEDFDIAGVEIVNGFETLYIEPSYRKSGGFQLEVGDAPAEEAFASDTNKPGIVYWPEFGDEKLCTCGHPYYRHFDTYDEMRAIGCKYCPCERFNEPEETR